MLEGFIIWRITSGLLIMARAWRQGVQGSGLDSVGKICDSVGGVHQSTRLLGKTGAEFSSACSSDISRGKANKG
jgi:hypothetical protein